MESFVRLKKRMHLLPKTIHRQRIILLKCSQMPRASPEVLANGLGRWDEGEVVRGRWRENREQRCCGEAEEVNPVLARGVARDSAVTRKQKGGGASKLGDGQWVQIPPAWGRQGGSVPAGLRLGGHGVGGPGTAFLPGSLGVGARLWWVHGVWEVGRGGGGCRSDTCSGSLAAKKGGRKWPRLLGRKKGS